MEAVLSRGVDPSSSVARHRGTGIAFERLLHGDEGHPDNFELSLVKVTDEYRTPRHRHNFEQVHLVVDGRYAYEESRWAEAGTLLYLPEGAFYGPQTGSTATLVTLQFGGCSAEGLMSYDEVSRASLELSRRGTFHDGTYTFVDDRGRVRHQDGYEAVWEHVEGRTLLYPIARIERPVVFHPEAHSWVPTNHAGVATRHLATLGERRASIDFIRVEAGASHAFDDVPGTAIVYLCEGVVAIDGDLHPARTAIKLTVDDRGQVFKAVQTALFYRVAMPSFV